MLNKGIGGEEAEQMVVRFDADVLDEAPDLVLWQVGSNSVLLNHPAPGTLIHQGVEKLKASGTEVVLMNPQYRPEDHRQRRHRAAIGRCHHGDGARRRGRAVQSLRRDALLVRERKNAVRSVHDPDGVHMNDWGYGCVAKLIAAELLEGTKRPAATATITPSVIKR